jgi:radical SAM superfamily enzyme YgiQ (UPF0313 family)
MKKQIYLIDLTHESKLGLGSDTMPLQLGLIGAYCLKEHGDKVDVQIFKFVDEFVEAVRKRTPFIIASSNYMWNIDLSYKIVSAIKERCPETIIVFGGPNYPDDFQEQVDWLRQYPNMDFYIFKDGEVPFSRLVGFLLNNPDITAVKKEKLPSCHAFADGKPCFGELEARLDDLSGIPSPYTTGLMDKFFEQKLLPTIQTNRGCPFACIYCAEGGSYYRKVCKSSLEHKTAEIDYIVSKVKHTRTLCITDSNFGMYEEDVDFCRYLSKVQKKTGYPEYLSCSTGKNQKERVLKCNELLGGIMRFTASVQSLNKKVLENIKRVNISLDEIMALSDQISDTDTHSYSEIILGLPGDSLEAEKESMAGLIQSGISNVTQHQLVLIYGAQVASRQSRQEFNIRGMFRPIQRCAGVYHFDGKTLPAIEIEEISVATNTLSFEDYLEARRLYLTIGLFYNDRIFGEIHTLLRLLHLSTWEWIELIHKNISNSPEEIKTLYDEFTADTRNELWESREDLIRDISRDIEEYISGRAGGNLIYKYRSQAIARHFAPLHQVAFAHLRHYLISRSNKYDDVVNEIERFSKYQKANFLKTDFEKTDLFKYDIVEMIKNPALARQGGSLEDVHYPVQIRIAHTPQQKELIHRQLDFYGKEIGGLTMLVSRFPIKRLYRTAEVVT